MTPISAGHTGMYFKARNGEAVDDFVDITHLGSTPKEFMAEVVKYMQRNHRNPFLSVVEGAGEIDVTRIANGVAVTTA